LKLKVLNYYRWMSQQKELEHVDQEIEAVDELTKYQQPKDVFYDYVAYDECEEDTDGSVEYADLQASQSVEELTSSAKTYQLAGRQIR
jgi:hypothetical protein